MFVVYANYGAMAVNTNTTYMMNGPPPPPVAKFLEPRSTLQMQLEQRNTKFLIQLSTWHYSMNRTTECRVHNHR